MEPSAKRGSASNVSFHYKIRVHPIGRRADTSFLLALYSRATATVEPKVLEIAAPGVVVERGKIKTTEGSVTIKEPIRVTAIWPEAGHLCTGLSLEAKSPDGRMLRIAHGPSPPWTSGAYNFRPPLTIPAGSALTARFAFWNDRMNRLAVLDIGEGAASISVRGRVWIQYL